MLLFISDICFALFSCGYLLLYVYYIILRKSFSNETEDTKQVIF